MSRPSLLAAVLPCHAIENFLWLFLCPRWSQHWIDMNVGSILGSPTSGLWRCGPIDVWIAVSWAGRYSKYWINLCLLPVRLHQDAWDVQGHWVGLNSNPSKSTMEIGAQWRLRRNSSLWSFFCSWGRCCWAGTALRGLHVACKER